MGFSACHWLKKDQRCNSSLLLVLLLLLLPSLDMLLPLTPMDMLHMLDTPMLLDMLVHMVLILMLELMVPTTLARGLLMLSLRLRLMLSMVPMDILRMLLPCLWICCFSLFLWIHRIFWIHWLPLCCPWCFCLWCLPLLGIRRNVFFFKKFMKRKVFILCPSIKSKTVMNFIFNILFTASDYLSSAPLLSL